MTGEFVISRPPHPSTGVATCGFARLRRTIAVVAGVVLASASMLVMGTERAAATGGVNMYASPTAGLWDQSQVWANVSGFAPNTFAQFSENVASDPTNKYEFLSGGVQTDNNGNGGGLVTVLRTINYLGGSEDCASAPEACVLVVYDPHNPFGSNATVQLSFGRIDLFATDPPNDPTGGQGSPLTGTVSSGQWIWAAGTGFSPNIGYQLNECRDMGAQLCRNVFASSPYVQTDSSPDGQYGSFGVALQVGRNVFGPWGSMPGMTASPAWALRDGQTVGVSATGLPPAQWQSDCLNSAPPNACYIGAAQSGPDSTAHIRSDALTFTDEDVTVSVLLSEVLQQQLSIGFIHLQSAVPPISVGWNANTGTLSMGYTVSRWLKPQPDSMSSTPPAYGYSPDPPEYGYYDCADTLAGFQYPAAAPISCNLLLQVVENGPGGQINDSMALLDWPGLQFAPLDLTAATSSAVLSTSPAGVTLSGQVTCTGFVPEQYLVHIAGTLSQTTGKKAVTFTSSFTTTVVCSGTMANPGTSGWSLLVPGTFKPGTATATLDVSSAGFTMSAHPLHIVSPVTIAAPPGKGKR